MIKRLTADTVKGFLPPRHLRAHKGEMGHVWVWGGAPGMMGAGALACAGALRGGAGLVTWVVPQSLFSVAMMRAPMEVLVWPIPRVGKAGDVTLETVLRRRGATSLVMGPGLSTTPSVRRNVKRWLSLANCPIVLDADGLNCVALTGWPRRRGPLVATPHPGEMARLLGWPLSQVNAQREEAVRRLAHERGVVAVLKGQGTLVSDGQVVWRNTTGNPGMATGGMGDVLAGLIGALIGQVKGASPQEGALRAALLGVYLHGLAGDAALKEESAPSLIATDVLKHLGSSFRQLPRSEERRPPSLY